ncbi:MAG TPA: hypothetical protein ENJ35_09680 [Gammaproteobacteria bacterium]|nr:hypothetical protein [Gammaproteobacteria bacterium]
MGDFLRLEAGTLTISAFFLLVAIFISTRPFMPAGTFRKVVPITAIVLAAFIGLHYKMTTSRMASVITAFNNNGDVICENRTNRNAAQSIVISKSLGWKLDGEIFTNPDFVRPFHSARCVPKP